MKTELTTQPIRSWLFSDTAKNELAVVGRGILSGERLANILYICVQKTPALANCTPASLMNACKTLVNMGCEPDNIHGYLVPRKCKDTRLNTWVDTCVPIPSARGLMRMARAHGITNLNIGTVYEDDHFQWFIRDGHFTMAHESAWKPATETILGFYCTWTDKDGHLHGERMTLAEVHTIRDRSDAYRRCVENRAKGKDSTCPWDTDFVQMALKTVIKRAAKQWDLPLDVQHAMLDADIAEFGTDKEVMRNCRRVTPHQDTTLEAAGFSPQPPTPTDEIPGLENTTEPPQIRNTSRVTRNSESTLFPLPVETSAPRMEADA